MRHDAALLHHIRALDADSRPLVGAWDEDAWSCEELMRVQAERRFQYALCQRIWWNLTAAERDSIRRSVLLASPEYRRSMHGPSFDLDCLTEVARLLAHLRGEQ